MIDSKVSINRGAAWPAGMLFCVAGVIVWSWIGAFDRLTWWLESFPALIAVVLLAVTTEDSVSQILPIY